MSGTEQSSHEVGIHTSDGHELLVETVGQGPALVVVQGGGVTKADYRRLAAALADRFTVHTYDRRYLSVAPDDPAEVTANAIDDLRTLLQATGARRLLGHSIGGFFALQAAVEIPLDAVALYDPAVCVDDLFPTAFFEPFARAVEAGDLPLAMAEMSRGLQSAGRASNLPLAVQRHLSRAFLATPIGRRMGALLPAVVQEDRACLAAAAPASAYTPISARVLLATGSRSPAYYAPICDNLAAVIPRGRSIRIPGASHNGPNIARPTFVQPLAEFLAAS